MSYNTLGLEEGTKNLDSLKIARGIRSARLSSVDTPKLQRVSLVGWGLFGAMVIVAPLMQALLDRCEKNK